MQRSDNLDKYSGQFVNTFNIQNKINNSLKKKPIMLNIHMLDIHYSHAQLIFVVKSKFHYIMIRKTNSTVTILILSTENF